MILTGVIGTVVLIPSLLVSLRWTRVFLTGWLIFFVAIFPTMGVLGFTIVIASDKYAYLPAVGLLLILAWLLEWIWQQTGTEAARRGRHLATVVLILLAAGLLANGTRRYLVHWQTTGALCDYMLDLAPNAYPLYKIRGYDYQAKGDYDLAIRDYSRAIELEPRFADAYSNRGTAYYSKGDYDRAIRDCTKAIELKPDNPLAYNNRGTAYYATGNYGQAIRDWTTAIDLKPDNPLAYRNRGTACFRKGGYDQAISDYTRAIQLKPDDADAYYNRGCAYSGKGNHHQAIRDYAKAIELKPNFADAYKNRAIDYYSLKQYDHARADVKTCRQLGGTPKPDFVKALIEATGRPE